MSSLLFSEDLKSYVSTDAKKEVFRPLFSFH
jgi:hypothetical protein